MPGWNIIILQNNKWSNTYLVHSKYSKYKFFSTICFLWFDPQATNFFAVIVFISGRWTRAIIGHSFFTQALEGNKWHIFCTALK